MIHSLDNILGLLPPDLSFRVDEMLEGLWDKRNRVVDGYTLFSCIIYAYQELGWDTFSHREWLEPDIQSLLKSEVLISSV